MKYLLTLIFISVNFTLFAQTDIMWQKCYGGTGTGVANCIRRTFDSGFIIAGFTNSNDGNVTNSKGGDDFWVLRLDSMGNLIWQKNYGGSGEDRANYIHETSDGGYVVCGYTLSNDSDVTGNHGLRDVWIIKIDENGNLQWQRTYGGTGNERAFSIFQTFDLGYAVAGYSDSDDGDVTFNRGFQDYWILKLNNAGVIQWQKTYGGQSTDEAASVQPTLDGGYVVSGASFSSNGNISSHHANNDEWVVKLDSSGTLKWEKSLGGSQDDLAKFAVQTNDGGYVVAGFSNSYDGDINSFYDENDFWIVKLDTGRNIEWQTSIGGSLNDYAYSLEQTSDGGFLVCGATESPDGAIIHNNGLYDFFVVKLNAAGNIQWKQNYGGTNIDAVNSAVQIPDGGYVIAGNTYSDDVDVSGNHGGSDVWVARLNSTTNINDYGSLLSGFTISPNPVSSETDITFNLADKKNIILEIRDVQGRMVKKFDPEPFTNGNNKIRWNIKNDSPNIPVGIYFITLKGDKFSETKKVEVIRN